MKEFGWTIEYTLNLTYPVFYELITLVKRVRLDAAIDEFYLPYGAAKCGGKSAKKLFNGAGSIFLSKRKSRSCANEEVTPEMIERANLKMKEIIRKRKKAMAEAVAT